MAAKPTEPSESGSPLEPEPDDKSEQKVDVDLLARARAGDDSAFGVLYQRHVHSARRLARYYATAPADAEDIVSEAFARVLSAIREGRGPRHCFRMYVLTTVRRTAASAARQAKSATATSEWEDFEEPIPFEDPVSAELERSMVARAFTALPERWRTVLWHTEVEGESPAQVAPLLGLSANGVAALAYRAREGLRTAYIQAHLSTAEVEKQCRACASKLASYLRESVSPRARRRIEEHLDGCDRCRLLLAELSEVSSSLRGVLAPIVLGPSASAYSAPQVSSPSGASPSATRPPSLAQADGEPIPVRASGFPTVGGAAVVTSVVAGFTALGFGAFFLLHPVSSAPPKQASGPPSPIGPTQPSAEPRPGPVGPWRQPSPRSRPNPPTASSTPEIAKVPTIGPSWAPPTPSPDVTASRPSGTPTAYPNPVLSDDNFATPPAGPTFLTYRAGQSIGGWKVTQNSVNLKSAHYWQTPKGSQSIDLNGDSPAPIAGAIAQTFGTVASRRYTVTFYLAGNVEGAPAVKTLVVQVGGVTQQFSFDTTGHSHSNMGWKVETVRFTATGAQTTLRFTSTTDPNSACGPVITNVHVKAG